jgi:multicomponent Na+:H+ antiporter subunit F
VTPFLVACALVLLTSVLAGLWRVVRGPTTADRMLAAQLFGTTGVAILLLLGQAAAAPAYWDVALVFAVLAAITGVAFVRRGAPLRRRPKEDADGSSH